MNFEDIEAFIKKNQPSVVRYFSEKHHGFENLDPECVGIICENDIYKVFLSDNEGYKKICAETESNSYRFSDGERKFDSPIQNLRVVEKPESELELISQDILKSIEKKKRNNKTSCLYDKNL